MRRSHSGIVVGAAAAVLAIAAGVAATSPAVVRLSPAVALIVPLAALCVARHRFQWLMLSPVWIAVGTLSGIGLIGFFEGVRMNGVGGGGILLDLNADDVPRTALLFASASWWLAFGAIFVALLRRQTARVRFPRVGMSSTLRTLSLAASAIPAMLVLLTLRGSFFHRDVYLAGSAGSNLFAVGQQLGVGAVAIAGYLTAVERGPRKVAAVALAVLYAAVFVGLGSRRIALLPICFALGMFAAAPTRRTRAAVVAAAVVSFVCLPLPLYFRGQSVHGLFPYLQALSHFSIAAVDWKSTFNNVLISFPITARTAFAADPIPLHNLMIELNPLPGRFVGWYQISPTMTLNPWTPFSAVGELGNYGYPALAFVWAGIGAALAYLDGRVRAYLAAGQPLVAVAIAGLAGLFAIQTLQYSLRASDRLLVYAVLLDIGLRVALRPGKLLSATTPETTETNAGRSVAYLA